MLSLSRKEGEYIQIGDNVKVSVSTIKGGQVRIAVEAPKEVGRNISLASINS